MYSLQWRHNAHSGVSNHRPLECLFNRVGPVTRKPFPFDDAVMYYSEGVCYISLRNVSADFETDRFVGWIFLKAVVWNKKVSLKSKDLRRQFCFVSLLWETSNPQREMFSALFEFSLSIIHLYILGVFIQLSWSIFRPSPYSFWTH